MRLRDLTPGDLVEWHHIPRGGRSFICHVPACVVRCGPERVTIAVRTATGRVIQRSVDPVNLHPAVTDSCVSLAELIRAEIGVSK